MSKAKLIEIKVCNDEYAVGDPRTRFKVAAFAKRIGMSG
jgi:hypothetical protein